MKKNWEEIDDPIGEARDKAEQFTEQDNQKALDQIIKGNAITAYHLLELKRLVEDKVLPYIASDLPEASAVELFNEVNNMVQKINEDISM